MSNWDERPSTSITPKKQHTNLDQVETLPVQSGSVTTTTKVLIGIGTGIAVFLGISAVVIFTTMALTKTGLFSTTQSTTVVTVTTAAAATTASTTTLQLANCSLGAYTTTVGTCASFGTAFNCSATTSICGSQNMAGATYIPLGSTMGAFDEETRNVTLPFSVSLYGITSTMIGVTTNSALCIGPCLVSYGAVPLPMSGYPSPTVFPYLEDLSISGGTPQGISYVISGTAPSRMVIFYYNLVQYVNPTNVVQIYVILYENIPNVVRVEYAQIYNNGVTATIGVQKTGSGPPFTQYSWLQASVNSGTVIIYNTQSSTYYG